MTHAEWLELRAFRDANGQCLCCGRDERVTETMCSHCRLSVLASQKRRRKAKIASGICIDCPDSIAVPAQSGRQRCEVHANIVADNQRKYRARRAA